MTRNDVTHRAPTHEAGSAFLVSLLALVVITLLGLSITLITQTELQIGANDRTANRVFYAADGALSVSLARALVQADYEAQAYEEDDPSGAALNIRYQIDSSPFYPILDSPCNLCQINDAGNYDNNAYRKINHAVATIATRIGGAGNVVLARNSQATMAEVQPWQSNIEAMLFVDDPDQLKKIKF